MEDQLSQKLKERFIKQMDDDKSNQQVALSHPQNNNHLPDENLSSKNVMNYFNDKGKDIGNDKDIGSFFDDKQQQEPSKDIYFNKKQSDPAELANKEDSTTNDNPAAHMIHVGISHDKTNDTDFAIVCCTRVYVDVSMCVYVDVSICVYVDVSMCVYVDVSTCVYVDMSMCM